MVEPYFIEHIEDAYGKTIYKANPEYACISCINGNNNDDTTASEQATTPDDEAFKQQPQVQIRQADTNSSEFRQAQRIIKSSSAYDMANILRDVIQHGTGRAALKIGRDDLGGKTGTTNDAKDAWFAGFNGKLVAIAWVGFDQPTTLGRLEYGGVAALPVWINFMSRSLEGTPPAWVTLDKNAKAPISHGQLAAERAGRNENRIAPPLARPIYHPAPASKPVSKKQDVEDFSDLPSEEILIPSEKSPPKMNNTQPAAAAKKSSPDSLEQLINKVD